MAGNQRTLLVMAAAVELVLPMPIRGPRQTQRVAGAAHFPVATKAIQDERTTTHAIGEDLVERLVFEIQMQATARVRQEAHNETLDLGIPTKTRLIYQGAE